MQEINTRSPALNAVTAARRLIDDPCTFMTQNASRLTRGNVTLEYMQICSAEGGVGDLTIASVGRVMSGFWRSCSAFLPGP